MTKLTRYFPVLLGFGVFGCNGSSQPSSFEQAAGEVNASRAALTASDPASTFSALDQVSTGSTTPSDNESADAGTDDSASDGQQGKTGEGSGKLERRGERPHGRDHGLGLLVWYADLDALKVCRDLHVSCPTSADPAACEEQVKTCVRPVLEQAFKAMCDEQVAACDTSGKSDNSCEEIRSTCSGDLGDNAGDGGTNSDNGDVNKPSAKPGDAAEGHGDSASASGEPSGEHSDAQKARGSSEQSGAAGDAAKAEGSGDHTQGEQSGEQHTGDQPDAG